MSGVQIDNEIKNLSADLCYRCEYDVRGIADDRPCPECGLLAARSRRPSDEIRFTHPRELRSLSLGIWTLLLAFLIAIGPPLLIMTVGACSGRPYEVERAIRDWPLRIYQWIGFGALAYFIYAQSATVLLDLAAVMLLAGVWIVSRNDRENVDEPSRDRWLRLLLRAFAMVPLIALVLEGVSNYLWHGRYNAYEVAIDIHNKALMIGSIGAVPLPFLLLRRLRTLARRSRSAHLLEHSTIVGVGASLSVLLLAGLAIASQRTRYFGMSMILRGRDSVPFTVILFCALMPALFGIWTIYLLTRFAFRFRGVANERTNQWRADDRSK